MKRTLLTALLLLSVLSFRAAIMPADRVGQWTRDRIGVDGGITTNATTYAIMYPTNTMAEINATIAAMDYNTDLRLSAGDYYLSGQMFIQYKYGNVIRGDGMSNTILHISGGNYGNIFVNGANLSQATAGNLDCLVNWTNGYTQGGSNIVVNLVSNIVVGDILGLDQLNNGTNISNYGYEGANAGAGRESGTRSQIQFVQVVDIDDNTLTVWPPIAMPNWSADFSPQAWKVNSGSYPPWAHGIGFADFTVIGTDSGPGGDPYQANFFLTGVENCWLSNVMSIEPPSTHVNLYGAFRCEVRHCYFYGTQGGASSTYAYLPTFSSSCLFEDNIMNKVSGAMVIANCSHNNVNSYNVTTNLWYESGSGLLLANIASHDAFDCLSLHEGDHNAGIIADSVHGVSGYNTVFRCRMTGFDPYVYPGVPSTQYLFAFRLQPTNHNWTAIGNILGTENLHTNYQSTIGTVFNGTAGQAAVYEIGLRNLSYAPEAGFADDALTLSTLYRHGNWDSANSAVVWDGGNADHSIPSSMIYGSKPAWFGSCPWPPFDPTGTINAATVDPTNIPAGYRLVYGVDPPSGSGGRPEGYVSQMNATGTLTGGTVRTAP